MRRLLFNMVSIGNMGSKCFIFLLVIASVLLSANKLKADVAISRVGQVVGFDPKLCEGSTNLLSSLVIDGTQEELSGQQNFDQVTIVNGGILKVTSYHPSFSDRGWICITANSIYIDSASAIVADRAGYNPAVGYGGPGQGNTGGLYSDAGGGGYGGYGGGPGGDTYGTESSFSIEMGSGGGHYSIPFSFAYGASGGGAITISATGNIHIAGQVTVVGANGNQIAGGLGSGAGSGGGILISGERVLIDGHLNASGGDGTPLRGCGGGGGRIKVFAADFLDISSADIQVSGGEGTGSSGHHSGDGTVLCSGPQLPAKKRLIIDTDPAIGDSDPDDITALIYAFLYASEFPNSCKIEGITYGYGNFGHQVPDEDGARGNDRMLQYYELKIRKMLEVLHEGGHISADPCLYRGHRESETWDKLGGGPGIENEATQYLIDAVDANPGELTIIALGTLTNVATAMAHYPGGPRSFVQDCKELWVIGGSVGWFSGNVVACDGQGCTFKGTEWNIWRDRQAAAYVFSNATQVGAEPNIKMAPLNVTMRWLIEASAIDSLRGTRLANYLRFPLQWWLLATNPWDNRQLDPNENNAIAFARNVNCGTPVYCQLGQLAGRPSSCVPAFPPYDTIGMALALEPSGVGADWEEHKVEVNTFHGGTIENDGLQDRAVVRIFKGIDDGPVAARIIARWSTPDRPVGNRLFINCSKADYVINSHGGRFSGPKDVTQDCDMLLQYYHHLPVGVAPYTIDLNEDKNAKYRGRLFFDIADGTIPSDNIVTNVKLHIYCDRKSGDWKDIWHRVNIYSCDPSQHSAEVIWNSGIEEGKYVDACDIGTLQVWRTVELGSKACIDLEKVAHTGGGQFALLLTEDDDDHPCAWFDTSKDWKAYLEVDFDIVNIIDFDDLAEFANYWLLNCSSPSWCNSYDLNQSGRVDFVDFALIAQKWLDQ